MLPISKSRQGDDSAGRVDVMIILQERPRIKVGPLEGIDGTPVVDIKPVLSKVTDA